MPSLELTALLITWFVIIPLLVIFPPTKILWLRQNIQNQRNARKVQTAVLQESFSSSSTTENDDNKEEKNDDDDQETSSPSTTTSTMRKRRGSTKKGTSPTKKALLDNSSSSLGLKNYIIPQNKQTIIVFVNPKSGGRLGEELLSRMREILSPNQVFDLSQKGIDVKAILNSFSSSTTSSSIAKSSKKNNTTTPTSSKESDNIRILVAGGDGSIGWVVTSCLAIGKRFPVGILPLGTGNDLARSIGWGSGATKSDVTKEALTNRIADVLSAKAAPFDHWTIEIDEDVDDILKERKNRLRKLENNNSSSSDDDDDENDFEPENNSSNNNKKNLKSNYSSFSSTDEEATMKRLNSTRRQKSGKSPTSKNDIIQIQEKEQQQEIAAAGDMPYEKEDKDNNKKKKKILSMFNYISVGIDAEIALRFHAEREEFPEEFSSQAANLVRYARLGFEKSFDSRPLNDRFEVYKFNSSTSSPDREKKEMIPFHPSWKCLMFSNILYYQRKNFWGDLVTEDDEEEKCNNNNNKNDNQEEDFKPACVQDGVLEAMAMAGTLHFGIVHCNLDHALRVAQEEGFELLLTEPGQAVQLDGEPWVQQNPCKIKISRAGQYPMLRGNRGGEWWNKIIG